MAPFDLRAARARHAHAVRYMTDHRTPGGWWEWRCDCDDPDAHGAARTLALADAAADAHAATAITAARTAHETARRAGVA